MTENIVYDILIKGGTIYDGTINDPKVADVGIRGDRIADIGQLEGGATRIIDATSLGVTPGFIDVHTHCDLTFQRAGEIREHAQTIPSWNGNWNYLYQGVTTVVTGNCGYGYTDVNHWLEMVDSMQFGTNVYHLVPHGEIRQELLGDDQPDQLTSKQLEAFKGRVEEAMEMGKKAAKYVKNWTFEKTAVQLKELLDGIQAEDLPERKPQRTIKEEKVALKSEIDKDRRKHTSPKRNEQRRQWYRWKKRGHPQPP